MGGEEEVLTSIPITAVAAKNRGAVYTSQEYRMAVNLHSYSIYLSL
jgi:hypothetical protein